ncbi:glycoside hydrolase family 15 protein [Noviherbaspirillum suwonense]|jgi:GH15 family glucan-1,4-alpha-glucosidase|uniref:Glucoamylase (Glucan-1,4-alpha-glucosidase), GH15 family n=1 Tax=Noviherbaspirillum suwonense TaxID=1224511 RepID=A0ABY1PZH9_9BURK|nr:glycoside hydrolase family 15 protein [Noviherbaspirillum suwonense]SMP49732.1 Glucoamylase (glucan-1,4-alpha-glucosidase), GH15 family [Noviherbaspirillum suwonense]
MAAPIEDYAMLGDCRSAALVSRDGSIDWLCLPRFDSATPFAALLGGPENGLWQIAPDQAYETSRAYRDGTMVLETRFRTADGAATLIDFMPVDSHSPGVVRIVEGVEGEVPFLMSLVMRFDYGHIVPWVERLDGETLTAVAGPELLVLRTRAPLHGVNQHTVSRFSVRAGQRVAFCLHHQASHLPVAPPVDAEQALRDTQAWWEEFSSRCPACGPYSAQVKRSLVTMKALTYRPTGGIVAAATTSLPEWPGGERNWDYRYCWLRDATMTLMAFMKLGYFDEARAWRDWLMRSIAGNPEQMQVMYGVSGERRLPEMELPWLSGYAGSRPVRIGNGAASQRQLDTYGEVVDAMTQALRGGVSGHPRGPALSRQIVAFLESAWREPDHGIWEVRGAPRHYVHSKVMAWAAFDRYATWFAETWNDEEGQALARRCRAVADTIHEQVCREGYDAALGSFVQYYGADDVDASLLHIVLTGFLPPDDSRVRGTVERIERQLMRGGLLQRYLGGCDVDRLPAGEGSFLICSFWLVDAWVLLGRRDDARALYERLLALCNDVGLLAEQYDPERRRMLGNFPQAFSHIGIINSALNLAHADDATPGPALSRAATG